MTMLPPDFCWHAVGTADNDRPNSLLLDNMEILRLSQRVDDGTWGVSLNNQRESTARFRKDCSSYDQGKKGAELWEVQHQDRLRAEIDRLRVARAAGKN